jgi:hypothetical protein
VKSGSEQDTEFYRGYLIDDQSDVAEGSHWPNAAAESANPLASAAGSYAVGARVALAPRLAMPRDGTEFVAA